MEVSTPERTQFAADVLAGLSASPKYLSSKYFYDDEGSRLFQEIMKLPEYYLTGCEHEIFETKSKEIYEAFAGGHSGFDLIELGAGDGTKTATLIGHFLERDTDISYSPIDISQVALDALTAKFNNEFLGSNIGNFSREESIDFFRSIRGVMNDDDRLFIGFDLQKDPHVIAAAYDDAAGVTARFNLNLLTRINRELGGNFNVDAFMHYANYRPIEGAARSYLISCAEQTVHIKALDRDFDFGQWEAVFMEISRKYSLGSIESLASESGFEVEQNFFDSRRYYCDSLWRPAK
jgi:L-histidine Nalpha-methyltransferase